MKIKIWLILALIMIVKVSIVFADQIGLNGIPLINEDSSSNTFSFMVGGHLYGASKNKSGYPSATFLANLDSINATNIDFFVSLGDLFSNLETDLETYRYGLLNKLKMPIFNAVGNHDVFQPALYESEFGKTYSSFQRGDAHFVILDTEINNGKIKDTQLELLKNQLLVASKSNKSNVFIFTHRPIWMNLFPEIKELFPGIDIGKYPLFDNEVMEILKQEKLNIYWISGSMGAYANESFFYHEENNQHFILNGIRDKKEDGILIINIDNNNVSFRPFSLTGKSIPSLESFDFTFWKKLKGEVNFGWPLVKYHILRNVTHQFFWTGGITCLIFYLLIKRLVIR